MKIKAKTLELIDYQAILEKCKRDLPAAKGEFAESLKRRIGHLETTIEVVSSRPRPAA